jgi:hypothetical protein
MPQIFQNNLDQKKSEDKNTFVYFCLFKKIGVECNRVGAGAGPTYLDSTKTKLKHVLGDIFVELHLTVD